MSQTHSFDTASPEGRDTPRVTQTVRQTNSPTRSRISNTSAKAEINGLTETAQSTLLKPLLPGGVAGKMEEITQRPEKKKAHASMVYHFVEYRVDWDCHHPVSTDFPQSLSVRKQETSPPSQNVPPPRNLPETTNSLIDILQQSQTGHCSPCFLLPKFLFPLKGDKIKTNSSTRNTPPS